MIITSFRKILLATLIIVSVFLLLPPAALQAATNGNIPADCEPLPEDRDLLAECNYYFLTHPPGKTYEPGTDPQNPAVFPADGISGIAASYSPKSDLVLIVAGKFASDSNRQIVGIMADPKTMQPKSSAFRIDGGTMTGAPKVAYSPDFEKFLVVWEDVRPCGKNCRSEYGRFVSSTGTPMGADFPIHQGAAFLSNVIYDEVNKKFVVLYENFGSILELRTIDEKGTVSSQIVVVNSFPYQGQAGVAFNSNMNEYWVAYAVTLSGSDTNKEDDRIMLSRVSAKTHQKIGEPKQLSTTRIGRLAVSTAHIAYSPKGGAVAIWSERGREGIIGTWGQTIFDDGTLSGEYPVITSKNNPYSEGYYTEDINYNPWTDSFFLASGDQDGNAWITETDLNGLVYESRPALGLVAMLRNFFAKLFRINQALAAAVGNFNVASTVTPYGAATFSSRNYQTVVGTRFQSPNAPGPVQPTAPPPTPTPTTPKDLTALPKLINQIYVWSLGIGALLAFLMIVLGGYYIMTAGGNAEQSSKGKEFITSALIGIAILFTAYLILNTINPDLVNFNIKSLNLLN